MHFDHTGNANSFPQSTWLLQSKELAYAQGTPTPFGINPATFSEIKNVKTTMMNGDYDVFGDGSVKMLISPGHTPGHQVLLVKLAKTGPVMLSGDLYHSRENRKTGRMPVFNADRADTLASFSRIETIVKNTGARFIVQHDVRDFAAMPKFPKYLD